MIKWPIRIVVSLLFLACATVWVRSYFAAEMWTRQVTTDEGNDTYKQTTSHIASGSGSLIISDNTLTMTTDNREFWAGQLRLKQDWQYRKLQSLSESALAFTRQVRPAGSAHTHDETVLGFGTKKSEYSTGGGVHVLEAKIYPYWPAVVTGLLPLFWIYRIFFPASKRKSNEFDEFESTDYGRGRAAA